ncbi:MAG: hypothetical protein QM368_05835 [Bacillota bacterium]|nr:hypothetical protein [Bacillota bacterium]HHU29585.1 hypothetical protein [Bacillota bacterium]
MNRCKEGDVMDSKKLKKFLLYGTGSLLGIQAARMLTRAAAGNRIGWQNIVETNLRSAEGKMISRPMGSLKNFPGLDDLVFTFSQLHNMPTPLEEKIDTTVVIGKKAKKPFVISMPIMIAPMAYGEA